VLVCQDEETGYKPMLHLVPASGVVLESVLPPVLAQWQEHFPGLTGEPSPLGVCLRLPPALERGHESQFALVLNTFLEHLDRGTWPQALPARGVSNLLICYSICEAKIFHMMEGHDDHSGVALPLLSRDRHRPAWYIV
jgi:hypothetical protein